MIHLNRDSTEKLHCKTKTVPYKLPRLFSSNKLRLSAASVLTSSGKAKLTVTTASIETKLSKTLSKQDTVCPLSEN